MILWNKFLNHNLLLSPAPQTAESTLLETPLYPAKLNTNQFIIQTLRGGLRSVKSVDVLQSSWAQPTPETSALLSFPPSWNISMMHWTADPAGHTCEVQSAVPSVAPGASTLFQLHHWVKMKGESRGRLQRERKERWPTGGKLTLPSLRVRLYLYRHRILAVFWLLGFLCIIVPSLLETNVVGRYINKIK